MEATVLITGFEPFNEHKINASWEAVKLLPEKVGSANIIREEIPVAYKAAEDKVKLLWETHSPHLVIHVGVSSQTDNIKLESFAHRDKYIKTDAFGHVHPTGYCLPPETGNDVLACELNINKICKQLKEHNFLASVSEDAGRYLCEYVYYTSLNISTKRTIFVHVPVLNKPYAATELTQALLIIIEETLKQLCQCTK